MPKITFHNAVAAIKQYGALLVFPGKSKNTPVSLWQIFHGDVPMDWNWSGEGSSLIPQLWHLRTELAVSHEVVYVKWYQDRATFFSCDLFAIFLSKTARLLDPTKGLSHLAQVIYATLLDDSPLGTKALKTRIRLEQEIELSGFDKALKELWRRFLIVGYGEVEEGGYPSLAIGATKLLFEELWDASLYIDDVLMEKLLKKMGDIDPRFIAYYKKSHVAVARRI